MLTQFFDQKNKIEDFLNQKLSAHRLPIYSSIDIRDAGFKVAPIDANLFPAGFNNLTAGFRTQAISAAQKTLLKYYPGIQTICIVPENHTRNKFYFDNLRELQGILQSAGYRVVLGNIHPDFNTEIAEFIKTEYGLVIFPLQICEDRVCINRQPVDLVILNNDLTGENAALLENVVTPVVPKPSYGWNKRQKNTHFEKYTQVAEIFSDEFKIDPWLITPLSTWQNGVNFLTGENLQEASDKADALIQQLQQKYTQYKISTPPAVFVKNNRGTYGMGIMVVSSGQELLEINRKTKNKMSVGKNKTAITEVLIQEGVPTILKDHECSAEPVMYLFDQNIAGGFLRVNCSASANANLNSPGMAFTSFRYEPYEDQTPRNYLYSVISRLAVWACALES